MQPYTTALLNAHKRIIELGKKGQKEAEKNQYGETALIGDVEAEEVVIQTLRDFDIPIRVVSEEHGTFDIGNPEYLCVLDGLDGSSAYKDNIHSKYGTMFSVFSNLDPKYSDYIFCGIMQHATGELFYTIRDGVKVWGNKISLKCSNNISLNNNTKIHIDENWIINRKIFSQKLKGCNTHPLKSAAAAHVELFTGQADLVLECTRKGNLEIAVSYGLITQAGGVMVDLQGNLLGEKKYLEFGQKEHIPIVSASTLELAKELMGLVTSDGRF